MLSFFRRLRRGNIKEAPIFKYIAYAIGEIILVVIGILIALQVNNWNEDRKENQEEEIILNALRDEISENQNILNNAILRAKRVLKSSNSILQYTGPGDPPLSKAESDSLMRFMPARITAEVSHSILNDLLATGRIHLIRNDTLKHRLTSWVSIYTDEILEEQGRIIHFTQNQIIPFLVRNYSFATQEIKKRTGFESSFKTDHRKIYQSVEFENLVLNKEINFDNLINSYQKVISYNHKLLLTINSELKKFK
jgi:hypothetical protein